MKRETSNPELTRVIEEQVEVDPSGPSDPHEINPKLASDVLYWSKKFGVTGQILHEAVRVHGTHVAKVKAALESHSVSLT